jgi:hypothetical protein
MLVAIHKHHMSSIFEPPYNYTDTWKEMARLWNGRFAVFSDGKRWLSGRNPLITREFATLDQHQFEKHLKSMATPLDRPILENILQNGGMFTMALGERASRIMDSESASIFCIRSSDNALYVICPGKDPPPMPPEQLLPVLDHALTTHKMESLTFLVLEKLSECSWLPSSVWLYPGSAGINDLDKTDNREIVYQSNIFGVWKRKILSVSKEVFRHRTQHPYVDDLGFLWMPVFLYRTIPLLWITMSLPHAASRKINDPSGRKIIHDLMESVNRKAMALKFSPLPFMNSFSEGAYDWGALKDVLRFRSSQGIDSVPVFIVRETTIEQVSRFIRTNDLIFRTKTDGEYLISPYQMSLEQTEQVLFSRLVSQRLKALPPFCAGDITSVSA